MTVDEFAEAMGKQAAAALAAIAEDLEAQGATDEEVAASLEALADAWKAALAEGIAAFRAELAQEVE